MGARQRAYGELSAPRHWEPLVRTSLHPHESDHLLLTACGNAPGPGQLLPGHSRLPAPPSLSAVATVPSHELPRSTAARLTHPVKEGSWPAQLQELPRTLHPACAQPALDAGVYTRLGKPKHARPQPPAAAGAGQRSRFFVLCCWPRGATRRVRLCWPHIKPALHEVPSGPRACCCAF